MHASVSSFFLPIVIKTSRRNGDILQRRGGDHMAPSALFDRRRQYENLNAIWTELICSLLHLRLFNCHKGQSQSRIPHQSPSNPFAHTYVTSHARFEKQAQVLGVCFCYLYIFSKYNYFMLSKYFELVLHRGLRPPLWRHKVLSIAFFAALPSVWKS